MTLSTKCLMQPYYMKEPDNRVNPFHDSVFLAGQGGWFKKNTLFGM